MRNARGFEDGAARRIWWIALLVWVLVVPIVALAAPSHLEGSVIRFALLLTPLAVLWPVCAAYSGGLIARWHIGKASGSMLWRGAGALAGVAGALLGGGLFAIAAGLGAGELARLLWLRITLARVIPPESQGAPRIPGFGAAASAQVLAGATGATAPFIERILATTLGTGGVSMLEYAARLLVVPAVLFEGGFAPLLLARWSNDMATGKVPQRREVIRSVGLGILLALAISALLALVAPFVNCSSVTAECPRRNSRRSPISCASYQLGSSPRWERFYWNGSILPTRKTGGWRSWRSCASWCGWPS
jgi:hypothetical protein